MSATERCQVAQAGGSAFSVWDPVVGVAAASPATAMRKDTRSVNQLGAQRQPVRDLVGLNVVVLGQVDDTGDGHVRVGSAAPFPNLLLENGLIGQLAARHGLKPPQRGVGEVNEELHLFARATMPDPAGQQGGSSLRISQHAHGQGAANIERLGAPLIGQPLRDASDGVIEVEGVLDVRADLDRRHAVVTDLIEHPHVPVVQSLDLGELSLDGMQSHHRLVEQPGERDRADLMGDRPESAIERLNDIGGLADGGLSDSASTPGQHLASTQPTPNGGQPVTQLQSLVNEIAAGFVGESDGQSELGRSIPGHAGKAIVSQRADLAVESRMEVRPFGCPDQQHRLSLLGQITQFARRRENLTGGFARLSEEWVHGAILLEHVFECKA